MLKKLLLALVALTLLGIVGFAVWRTALLPPRSSVTASVTLVAVDRAAAADRLVQGIRYATVAQGDAAADERAAFTGFLDFLRTRFPLTHERLSLDRVSEYSLLYTWRGSKPELPPVLLAAHMDVVPADAAGWTYPPFDGVIADGFVWGRGALDDKNSLLAILEASEALLQLGYQPERTLMFAFGQDEEISGERGAAAIAALLAHREIKAAFTLDEGGAVTRGFVPGITRPVASVMAGEKGYLTVKLKLSADGGHSSTPPVHGVIGRLARAVTRLEDQPMPPRLIAPIDAMLAGLAPEMDYPTRLLVANRDWLTPLLFRALGASRTTAALIRTTTAATMFNAGVKDNVLPASGEVLVNFRLLPGDSIAHVLQHVRDVIGDDAISITPVDAFNHEAPPASDATAPAFKTIERAINEVFPEALVTSGIVLGATDNRHYAAVRQQGYGFSPMPYTKDDENRIHGVDERIAVADYLKMIQFYAQLMRASTQPQ
jgi:carboxypeptidase PM20D1